MHNNRLLTIGGTDGRPYQLGRPMEVHDGSTFLGVLDPVHVARHGTEMQIEHFLPSEFVLKTQRNFGPLILLEVAAFLVERFASLQVIHFRLNREIEIHGNSLHVACSRAELLQDMGARGVTINPQPDADMAGNFVVCGSWEYNERNVAALHGCLAREQEIYRNWPQLPLEPDPPKLLGRRLKRRLMWGRG